MIPKMRPPVPMRRGSLSLRQSSVKSWHPCLGFLPVIVPALVFLLVWHASPVHAVPQFILTSTMSKCIKVEVFPATVLLVNFEAPDVSPSSEKEALPSRDSPVIPEMNRDREPKSTRNALTIQMNHFVEENGRRQSAGANKTGTRRLHHVVTQRQGQLEFFSGQKDGHVEVCAQSYLATKQNPKRFAFRVIRMTEKEHEQHKANGTLAKATAMRKAPVTEQQSMEAVERMVQMETSRITIELDRFTRRVEDISERALSAKSREASFNQSSVKLQRAVRSYPLFRVGILVVAALWQVNHVVSYMKRHRLY